MLKRPIFRFYTEGAKWLIALFLLTNHGLWAHPMPNTLLNLSVRSDIMTMHIQIPTSDFETAFGSPISNGQNTEAITDYFIKHIKIEDKNKQQWASKFVDFQIHETTDVAVGAYSELVVNMQFTPISTEDMRVFTVNYDAIIHQVATHKALINIAQDWENGVQDSEQQLGVIEMDVPTNRVYPLHVSLEKGNNWKGFKRMVKLGIAHIAEGTDHLLFVLVLLLPAPLLVSRKKWASFGGTKYALTRLFKIITAFTIGHSLTLLIGALGWLRVPSQPVEILIAVSIFISAIHALTPFLYGKEIFIAGGFGLIHGLAFASILEKFQLEPVRLALSILGFNIGIELMQLFVVLLFIPSFLLLSPFSIYKWVRIEGAILTLIASIGWLFARISGQTNRVADMIENSRQFALPTAAILFVFACLFYIFQKYTPFLKSDFMTKKIKR